MVDACPENKQYLLSRLKIVDWTGCGHPQALGSLTVKTAWSNSNLDARVPAGTWKWRSVNHPSHRTVVVPIHRKSDQSPRQKVQKGHVILSKSLCGGLETTEKPRCERRFGRYMFGNLHFCRQFTDTCLAGCLSARTLAGVILWLCATARSTWPLWFFGAFSL